ncbi:MAG: GNAT family N-acetyltransferase [Acidimicrobiia bacterium]|nr:GNAT family N-acetyltransferase [Acidimicrobiia bacterium]
MRQYEHLQCGPDRLRVAPWRADPTIAELGYVVSSRPPQRQSIERGLYELARRGYRGVVTNALGAAEQSGYLAAGFVVHERLHLLAHDLTRIPEIDGPRLRRGRRRDHPQILGVDSAAFSKFWRLDHSGLRDAIAATPASRVRVDAGSGVAGYAVTGRAAGRGYLQRLAVHPEHQGQRLGASLVVDSLRWLRRRGCQIAMVNTQEINERALHLYQDLGFTPRPDGLAVLRYDLETPS